MEEGRPLASRRSSLLFAHFGLTGPAALDVSRVVSGHPRPASLTAEIDLLPDRREPQLSEWLKQESIASGKKQLAAVVGQVLPRRLAETVLQLAGIAAEQQDGRVKQGRAESDRRHAQALPAPLTGTLGFKKAEVTAGGISLAEVDSRTMQSRLVPRLFFAGEVLDLDGPIGGYNFQAAWSTGWLAGGSA